MTADRPKAVVFDLDGTLVDTAPDLHRALNAVLADEGRDPVPLETVAHMVGDGARALVARGFAATGAPPPERRLDDLVARYVAVYARDATRLSRPYPGVAATLERLAGDGHALAVCTNKPHGLSVAVLAGLGLDRFFGAVVGGDSLAERKPAAAPLLAAIAGVGAEPATSVMVGDSDNDVAVARNAGTPVIVVTYGYSRVPPDALDADARIDRFDELPAALARLRRRR